MFFVKNEQNKTELMTRPDLDLEVRAPSKSAAPPSRVISRTAAARQAAQPPTSRSATSSRQRPPLTSGTTVAGVAKTKLTLTKPTAPATKSAPAVLKMPPAPMPAAGMQIVSIFVYTTHILSIKGHQESAFMSRL